MTTLENRLKDAVPHYRRDVRYVSKSNPNNFRIPDLVSRDLSILNSLSLVVVEVEDHNTNTYDELKERIVFHLLEGYKVWMIFDAEDFGRTSNKSLITFKDQKDSPVLSYAHGKGWQIAGLENIQNRPSLKSYIESVQQRIEDLKQCVEFDWIGYRSCPVNLSENFLHQDVRFFFYCRDIVLEVRFHDKANGSENVKGTLVNVWSQIKFDEEFIKQPEFNELIENHGNLFSKILEKCANTSKSSDFVEKQRTRTKPAPDVKPKAAPVKITQPTPKRRSKKQPSSSTEEVWSWAFFDGGLHAGKKVYFEEVEIVRVCSTRNSGNVSIGYRILKASNFSQHEGKGFCLLITEQDRGNGPIITSKGMLILADLASIAGVDFVQTEQSSEQIKRFINENSSIFENMKCSITISIPLDGRMAYEDYYFGLPNTKPKRRVK